MRKRIMAPSAEKGSLEGSDWLDVEQRAEVEITSEDPAYPVEGALRPEGGLGWRAAESGRQTIRLLFDRPERLSRVRLVFDETEEARTQEFVLAWCPDGGRSYQEIVRQQYVFSPPANTREIEDYTVELDGVTALELRITPDISGNEAVASLTEWLLA